MSASAANIRRALATEAERLADIGFRAWEQDLKHFLTGPAASPHAEQQRLRQVVHELFDRIIVAEVEGRVVGWCARARSRAYIPYLFVAPEAQNRGIGRLLLRRMESMMELEGADRVQLDTLSDNVRAVIFYQHQGYRILALRGDPPGRDAQASVRLEKRLSPYRGPVTDDEA